MAYAKNIAERRSKRDVRAHAIPRLSWLVASAAALFFLAAPPPARASWLAVNNGQLNIYGNADHYWDALLMRSVGCVYPPIDICANPGAPTSARVVDGAQVYMVQGLDDSTVVMNGGALGFLRANHNADVTMNAGSVYPDFHSLNLGSHVMAEGQSTLRMNGGFVGGSLLAYGESNVVMTGGQVTATATASWSANLTITGGLIENYVAARSNSRVLLEGGQTDLLFVGDAAGMIVTGGTVATAAYAEGNGQIWIVGSDFEIDGSPVGLGDILPTSGLLTGLLENGDALALEFSQGEVGTSARYTGTITLAPEPGTALLLGLGLGVLSLRRERRRR